MSFNSVLIDNLLHYKSTILFLSFIQSPAIIQLPFCSMLADLTELEAWSWILFCTCNISLFCSLASQENVRDQKNTTWRTPSYYRLLLHSLRAIFSHTVGELKDAREEAEITPACTASNTRFREESAAKSVGGDSRWGANARCHIITSRSLLPT